MQNNYLLECSDDLSLLNKQKEIIDKMGFTDQYQAIYDLEENMIDDVLEDLDTYSFLSPKKIIIVRNSFIDPNDKKIERILKYIDNSNPDNLFIMTANKLDSRTSLVKNIKKNKNINYIKIDDDPVNFVKNKLVDYKISLSVVNYLVEKCKSDITKLDSECDKLMAFKIDNKEIIKEDIDNLVVKKLGDSNEILYALVNSIMSKDKRNALIKYNELLEYNVDANSMIGLMASQIKLINQIKLLKEDNLSNQEIADTLKLKSVYQVKKLSEYIYKYTYKEIASFTHLLANTDLGIKSGRIDVNNAVELLIINL